MARAVIVGGGASGMLAAIMLGESKVETIVLERMEKVCKKIYATGNGKCNFTNKNIGNEHYNGGAGDVSGIISRFDNKDVISFFEDCGVPSYVRDGYVYPHSRQASSIALALERRAQRCPGITIYTRCNVKLIRKTDKGFSVEFEENQVNDKGKNIFLRKAIDSDYVIISAGGRSVSKLGSDGSGTYLAKKMGHNIIKELPALTPFDTYEDTAMISGVRTMAKVNGEAGEIIFTDTGISGIPVFQISSELGRRLDMGEETFVMIDFAPDLGDELLTRIIKRNIACNVPTYQGIVPDKLALYLENRIEGKDEQDRAGYIRNVRFNIKSLGGFDKSQVTGGGVDVKQIDTSTMQSRICERLYMCGEVLDVDGICGGYNLQWAWSSGYIAAMSIIRDALQNG